MGKGKEYNGHKNWNHWNVSLWINNDERLYEIAKDCLFTASTKKLAAELFIDTMKRQVCGTPVTPDGAPYTVSSVLAALRGLEP